MPDAVNSSIAHEYFHHFQRAHALDRGLDYQYGPGSVGAPTWWIEGAASLFNRLWTLQAFYDSFNGFMHSRDPNESPPVGFFPTEPINTYADFWRIRSE